MNQNTQTLQRIAVFCGSNFGTHDDYREQAAALGTLLAEQGITLVYGGTSKGLMGVAADAALAAGGEVFGVINRRLFERGHLHPRLSGHEVVDNMRQRKARMAELADAFIALPGGLGTLEELLEAATLSQLRDHVNRPSKACGALNIRGFYSPLQALLSHAAAEGFMPAAHLDLIAVADTPAALLAALEQWVPPDVNKWIGQPGS
ncbi:LOG family protein [Alloalcanivorax dieselolei B5]|uniref:Cytokinin riboside 5'-monophosphate phosphoribohydrolase n=1 Tax=Alcanivorax dieselolei (strain DSM 16502 / CGMCC 1.3690 / MCCC 1A00001 / B-5) TaxID=930169 RepID=K0CJ60_ALCDB|nr:TIGR00730 family Rossman fold protein [Alloalcanivorax dieselolei]AFT71601.1 LOG family protein [Alloalcanivorax dieselolei B5]GGJ89566.1 putative cytokinin riboside 5'-monophosphate phosphoribohydrolase [Alloalcanivorax dieselolei]